MNIFSKRAHSRHPKSKITHFARIPYRRPAERGLAFAREMTEQCVLRASASDHCHVECDKKLQTYSYVTCVLHVHRQTQIHINLKADREAHARNGPERTENENLPSTCLFENRNLLNQ